MKKFVFLLSICLVMLMSGCEQIEPNPYQLTKETRESMKPAEQEAYVKMIKSLETLVASLNNASLTYEEQMEKVNAFYADLPKDWTWKSDKKPIDKAWRFFMEMKDGFMGCERFDFYTECKDDVDALGEELSNCFIQANDRRKALIVSEEQFYQLYKAGKEK